MKAPQILRCIVDHECTGTFPKETNALLFGASGFCGVVLIDGQEKITTFNWGWIKVPVNEPRIKADVECVEQELKEAKERYEAAAARLSAEYSIVDETE